jgi:spore cortex biosynthesis protein YabQ
VQGGIYLSGLFAQIQAFVLTLLLGVIAGLVFHFYQITIKSTRIDKYALYICDFLMWLIMFGVVFASMLLINQGEMRVYVLIALFIGAFIYFRMLASRLSTPLSRMAKVTLWLIGTIVTAIIRPIAKFSLFIREKFKKSPPPPDDDNDNIID